MTHDYAIRGRPPKVKANPGFSLQVANAIGATNRRRGRSPRGCGVSPRLPGDCAHAPAIREVGGTECAVASGGFKILNSLIRYCATADHAGRSATYGQEQTAVSCWNNQKRPRTGALPRLMSIHWNRAPAFGRRSTRRQYRILKVNSFQWRTLPPTVERFAPSLSPPLSACSRIERPDKIVSNANAPRAATEKTSAEPNNANKM